MKKSIKYDLIIRRQKMVLISKKKKTLILISSIFPFITLIKIDPVTCWYFTLIF